MKKRMSNLEILRIICMLFIVLCHVGHSKIVLDTINCNQILYKLVCGNSAITLNLFIMITGYFLINSEKVKIDKIIKLWLQLFLYSVGIYIIFVIFNIYDFSIKSLIECCLPISFNQWWFASTYFVLYIFHPYINKFLKSLSKKEYKEFILLQIIIYSLLRLFTLQEIQYNNLLIFIMIYSIAGYIRLYLDDIKFNNKMFVSLISIYLMSFILSEILCIYGTNSVHKLGEIIVSLNSPFIIVISVLIFILFKNINIKYNKSINLISSATFGVYLIHDNNYMRDYLWNTLFKYEVIMDKWYFMLYVIGFCLLVYIICTLIELIRIYLLENNYMKLVNKYKDCGVKLWQKVINH